jgi:hypothetical protein
MESSRGGPLTTFIMMLPLIVVPAMAMFRPSGPEGSLLSSLLSADSNDSAASDSPGDDADIDGFSESDFEAEFAELLGSDTADSDIAPGGVSEEPTFSSEPERTELQSVAALQQATQSTPPSSSSTNAEFEELTVRLRVLGATRTLWFYPGDRSAFGFVAFFPASQGSIRYRFEAIATSKNAAVRDVIQQANEWKSSQNP